MTDKGAPPDGDCIIALADGRELLLSVEDVEGLWARLPEIYHSGRDRRSANRVDLANPAAFGLVPYDVPFTKSRVPSWGLPNATGVWPAGIPMLTFLEDPALHLRQGIPLRPSRRAAARHKKEERVEDHWVLSFSRMPGVPLLQCQWGDIDGFSRLANTLRNTSVQALANQLLLTLTQEQRNDILEDDHIKDHAYRLLDLAEELPAISASDYSHLESEDIFVSQAHVFDPGTCRYVEVPSMVVAHVDQELALKDLDKGLSKAGLIALRGFRTQGWGDTQRLAVKKGYGARVGTLDPDVWQVLSVESAKPAGISPSPPVLALQWFRNTLAKSLGAVTGEPIAWDTYQETKGGK